MVYWHPDTMFYWHPNTTVYWHPDTTVYWHSNTMVYWHPDTMVYWNPDTMVYWHSNTTVYWHPDTMFYWHPDTMVYWNPDTMVYWHPDTMVYLHPDTMVYWNSDTMVYWHSNTMVYWHPDTMVYWYPDDRYATWHLLQHLSYNSTSVPAPLLHKPVPAVYNANVFVFVLCVRRDTMLRFAFASVQVSDGLQAASLKTVSLTTIRRFLTFVNTITHHNCVRKVLLFHDYWRHQTRLLRNKALVSKIFSVQFDETISLALACVALDREGTKDVDSAQNHKTGNVRIT
jgi:hypothetical protein